MVNTLANNGVSTDGNAVNVELAKDSGRNASIDAIRQENNETDAMRQNAWHIGNCAHCQTEFKKRTVWQKYCTEDCRKAAYEQRNGKQWRNKKTA